MIRDSRTHMSHGRTSSVGRVGTSANVVTCELGAYTRDSVRRFSKTAQRFILRLEGTKPIGLDTSTNDKHDSKVMLYDTSYKSK